MKAAVLNAFDGKFDIENIDLARPQGREVLVRVKASGLCHSDLHMAENNFGVPLPAAFGHELAGIVEEIGPEVRDFSVGDHVVGSLVQFCGHCPACLDGRTYQCQKPQDTLRASGDEPRLSRAGAPVTQMFGMGAFAEYALIHENQLVGVPRQLPFPQAALLGCGCITGAGAAINSADVKPGESIAVIGVGGVGLNILSGARLVGAERIIAIDTQAAKADLADKFGATDFIDASTGDVVALLNAIVPGGVDHVFEVVGLKSTSEQAVKLARKGGSAYFIGLHKPGGSIEIDMMLLIAKQLTLKGIYMGSTNIKRDIPMYAQLYLQGRFNLDDLISREIDLTDINDAYADLKQGAVARCVITSF